MDENIKRTIILENYQNPKNKGLLNKTDYEIIRTNSKSCIDQVDLEIKINGDLIEDIRFDGEACAICTSSTSIMINSLIGKTVKEALVIIENFENMIDERTYDKDILSEAIVYCDISKQPNRKICATLTWTGLKDFLKSKI